MRYTLPVLFCLLFLSNTQAQVTSALRSQCREAARQLDSLLEAYPHEEAEYQKIEAAMQVIDSLLPRILTAGNWKKIPLAELLGKGFLVSGSPDGRISVIAYYTNNGGTYHMYNHWVRLEDKNGKFRTEGPLDFFPTDWVMPTADLYIGTGSLRTCGTCHASFCELWSADSTGRPVHEDGFMMQDPYNNELINNFNLETRQGNVLREFEWDTDSLLLTLQYQPDDLSGPIDEIHQTSEAAELPPVLIQWKLEGNALRLWKKED